MKKEIFAILTVICLFPAAGRSEIPWTATGTKYLTGPQVCAKYGERVAKEFPLWVQVPIQYENPALGKFPLYAWTQKPLDFSKKVMVFFDGGPGSTSHSSSMDLSEWNVVFFDQRGNTCSRPPTETLYLQRDFYSSENTARDVEEIRKALGVEQISVYGVSYGTVPAHLYAFLFPQKTRAVVLEGVIAQADADTLINNEHRLLSLQMFFDSLPASWQQRIQQVSETNENIYWFSDIGRTLLYLDKPRQAFRTFLERVLENDEALNALLPSFAPQKGQDEEFGFSQVMMSMLSCKEMGMNASGASFRAKIDRGRLVREVSDRLREEMCSPLGFVAGERFSVFRSEDYPLYVPVTYVQGSMDGATSADQAQRSYEKATRSSACLISVIEGGHLPLQGGLSSGYEKGPSLELRRQLLSKALLGKKVPERILKSLSKVTEISWEPKCVPNF